MVFYSAATTRPKACERKSKNVKYYDRFRVIVQQSMFANLVGCWASSKCSHSDRFRASRIKQLPVTITNQQPTL